MRISFLLFLSFLFAFPCLFLKTTRSIPQNRYDSIFSFGDSLSDTGNLLIANPLSSVIIGKFPYGETFGRPTGRSSDGRLIVDFIAEEFGIPLLRPYLALHFSSGNGHDFRLGANFAVAGATALDAKFFYDNNIGLHLVTKLSLNIQIGWFKEFKTSRCNTTLDCADYLGKSLFLVGEIGYNDYNYAFLSHLTVKQVRTFVPQIVEVIATANRVLIEEGAVDLVVPGIVPLGCAPAYLTLFPSPNIEDYDPRTGCLIAFNELAQYHNVLLKNALQNLRLKYPRAKIIYADYYGAILTLVHSPQLFGFQNGAITACCGGGGPYNYNQLIVCGGVGSKLCDDPSTYVSWDGIHLTEAAYQFIATGLIKGGLAAFTSSPPFHTLLH
ncbi:Lipase [Macleaya cordata]|uniref:Lipase n=1 Tax=Macleaya cordata TaxID=56857 RepID=A0A200QID1_MACCD|nr:Lipase [Macleaya cordata]